MSGWHRPVVWNRPVVTVDIAVTEDGQAGAGGPGRRRSDTMMGASRAISLVGRWGARLQATCVHTPQRTSHPVLSGLSDQMFTATLRCGTVLTYEAPDLVPVMDDLVPCRRHGYCFVGGTGRSAGSGAARRLGRRAAPRGRGELLEWLGRSPVTTVHVLRRQRFTLRLIAQAERDGDLDVDLTTGRVSLRHASSIGRRSQANCGGPSSMVEP